MSTRRLGQSRAVDVLVEPARVRAAVGRPHAGTGLDAALPHVEAVLRGLAWVCAWPNIAVVRPNAVGGSLRGVDPQVVAVERRLAITEHLEVRLVADRRHLGRRPGEPVQRGGDILAKDVAGLRGDASGSLAGAGRIRLVAGRPNRRVGRILDRVVVDERDLTGRLVEA